MAAFVLVVGFAVFKFNRQLPPSLAPPEDHRLVEQDERIELLEDELQRVKDQADFTEKLLTERDDAGGDSLD
jgi:hypothetical protein